MNCNLLLQVVGQNEDIKLGYIEYDQNLDQLGSQEFLTKIVQNLKSNKDAIITISGSLIGNSNISSYDKDSIYIPNYDPDRLIEEFSDLDFGKKEYLPDILLVDDTNTVGENVSHFFPTRIQQQNQKQVIYIVPRSAIRMFANHARALSKLNELVDQKIEKSPKDVELKEEMKKAMTEAIDFIKDETLQSQLIKSQIDGIVRLYYNSIQSAINKINKTIQAATQSKSIKDKKKKIREELNNINNKYIYLINFLRYNNRNIDDIKEEYENFIDQYSSVSIKVPKKTENSIEGTLLFSIVFENKLPTLTKDLTSSQISSNEIQKRVNKYLKKVDVKEIDNLEGDEKIREFYRWFLSNASIASNKLSIKLYERLKDLSLQLAGFSSRFNSQSQFVNTLSSFLKSKYFEEKKLDISLKDLQSIILDTTQQNISFNSEQEIYNWLYQNFIKYQKDYTLYESNIKGDKITFVRAKQNSLSKIGLINDFGVIKQDDIEAYTTLVNTVDAILPMQNQETQQDEKYKGFYIYQINQDGKNKYFYTRQLVSVNDDFKLFDSLTDLHQEIDSFYGNQLLRQSTYQFIQQKSDSDSEIKTINHSNEEQYKFGQYIDVLEIPSIVFESKYYKNLQNIPSHFTINDFERWVEYTFSADHTEKIKSAGLSMDQMALIYQLFKGQITATGNNIEYSNNEKEISNIINAIVNAETARYKVIQNTFNAFGRYNDLVTRIQKRPKQGSLYDSKKETQSQKGAPLIQWIAIQQVFKENGIILELRDSKWFKEKFNQPDSRGTNIGNIIYININKATLRTPFHEYTHLLLAIVKSRNPELRRRILLEFDEQNKKREQNEKNIKNWEKEKKDKLNLYKDTMAEQGITNEDEKNLYVLEEIFADKYGDYLLFKNTEFSNLFNEINQELSKTNIFGTDPNILFKNAQSQYNVFSVLSEAVNQYEKSIGFGISGGINITEKASIDKTILEKINNIKTLQKQKFDNLEDKEDGFYSYCYEV